MNIYMNMHIDKCRNLKGGGGCVGGGGGVEW